MQASDFSQNLQSIALLVMAISGGMFLLFVAIKGRSFVAQWREFKITMNPQRLEEFSVKMDEVVKSVNNKLPDEPTLFQTVKQHTSQLQSVNARLSTIDAKLDYLVKDLTLQIGLRITEQDKEK